MAAVEKYLFCSCSTERAAALFIMLKATRAMDRSFVYRLLDCRQRSFRQPDIRVAESAHLGRCYFVNFSFQGVFVRFGPIWGPRHACGRQGGIRQAQRIAAAVQVWEGAYCSVLLEAAGAGIGRHCGRYFPADRVVRGSGHAKLASQPR